MPTKKPSLFDTPGKEPKKPKKPTLFQYIKQNKDVEYPITAPIETIWFPGNWDNYSVETDKFRASINPNHPLYKALDVNIVKHCEDVPTALLIELQDNEGTICFRESNLYGDWKAIGNAGYRFAVAADVN